MNKEINQKTVRFSDAIWYKPKTQVLIGGAGGIGSWLALSLARQECKIAIYDNDIINEVNMAGQFYQVNQINDSKVSRVRDNVELFTNEYITTFNVRYDKDSMCSPITFSAFDNLSSRKLMFEKWVEYRANSLKNNTNEPFVFIDGRLLAESMQIFLVYNDETISNYRTYLWDDSEVADAPCSYKATTYCSMIIAGMMTALFNNYMSNYISNSLVRNIPFLTKIDLPVMNMDFINKEYENIC